MPSKSKKGQKCNDITKPPPHTNAKQWLGSVLALILAMEKLFYSSTPGKGSARANYYHLVIILDVESISVRETLILLISPIYGKNEMSCSLFAVVRRIHVTSLRARRIKYGKDCITVFVKYATGMGRKGQPLHRSDCRPQKMYTNQLTRNNLQPYLYCTASALVGPAARALSSCRRRITTLLARSMTRLVSTRIFFLPPDFMLHLLAYCISHAVFVLI